MAPDLLGWFPPGFSPRPEQSRLLDALGAAIGEAEADAKAPHIFLVEAPPGVGKSHIAMTVARWSDSAYLLTSQKLLQDQYEREFGADVQLVKGRDNYLCERYPGAPVTSAYGACRRRGGPPCSCPYARAKAAARAGPIFCTNTSYFLTLRQWRREDLDRRRVLIVDEAHTLEAQLANVFTVAFPPEQMRAWFGAMLPRFDVADGYRELLDEHHARLQSELSLVAAELDLFAPDASDPEAFLRMPPSPREVDLLAKHDTLENALARVGFFLDAPEAEWIVRYPDTPAAALELIPLSVAPWALALLFDAADLTVLSSAFLGHHGALAECFGLEGGSVRALRASSPFPLARRPIVYRPLGALSRDTLAELEPAVFTEVAAILARHPRDKGLIHVPSYAAADRLMRDLAARAPLEHRRLVLVESAAAKRRALELHRASPLATVLVSPSLREGVDLPDDQLRFQIVTKMPYPDLGDPWTAARQARDHRWYALETAKALVQAYGRSCRHADDHGVTYVLDTQFARFLTRYRPLLPSWFLDAAHAALIEAKRDHRT
jgi:ATP-dependent DNA helicase DinG